MKSLFIDSTEEMALGVLNKNREFEEYCHFADKQGASLIHSRLNDLLQRHKMCLGDVKKIYIASGPGSYTGIRVVEGMAQIMKWQGVDVLSFYQFEIPFMVGIFRGVWVSQAWKGELFVYSWEGERSSEQLVPFCEYDIVGEEYSFGDRCCGVAVQSNRNLLQEYSSTIFDCVNKRGKYLPPYYYRKVEHEFKPGR